MNKLKLVTLIGSTLLFTACGGGGGSNDSGGAGGGGTGGGSNTVTLSADIVQETLCLTEIPATHAELVVYDDNWAIKSRHKPDAQGKITATIPTTQFVNIALITQAETSTGTRTYIQSRAQHPVGDLGKFYAAGTSASNCECTTKDIQASSIQMMTSSRITLIGATDRVPFQQTSTYSGVFRDAQICRTPGGSWPALTVLNSQSTELAAGSLNNYDINTELEIQLDKFATYYPINVDTNFNNLRITHEIEANMLSTTFAPGSIEAPVITELDTLTRTHLSGTYFYQVTENNQSVNVFAGHRKAVNFAQSDTPSLPMPDMSPLEGLAAAFDNFISSDSTSYSIPNANQYAMFSIRADISLMDGSEYTEVFYGPMQGKYPENALPEDYNMEDKLETASDIYLELTLTKYASETNYQSALKGIVKKSRVDDADIFGGEWSDYSYVSIAADLTL